MLRAAGGRAARPSGSASTPTTARALMRAQRDRDLSDASIARLDYRLPPGLPQRRLARPAARTTPPSRRGRTRSDVGAIGRASRRAARLLHTQRPPVRRGVRLALRAESDSSSRLRTSATLAPPACSPSAAAASAFASSTIRSRSLSRPPRTTKSAACARAPHSSISSSDAPGAARPESERRGTSATAARDVARLDRKPLAFRLRARPRRRASSSSRSRIRATRGRGVGGGHRRPAHRALRRGLRVLPGPPRAADLLEPALGLGQLAPRLAPRGPAASRSRLLDLLDLPRDRLERRPAPGRPAS